MNEEILIRMGVDARPVTAALRTVRKTFDDFGQGLKNSFANAFRNLAAPISTVAAIAQLRKALADAERITNEAADKGVSTDFLQDLENVAKASNISGEAVERMVGKWARSLPTGASLESEFRKLADVMASIPDPAEKARLAVEKFGERGAAMVRLIGGGTKAFQEMASGFAKWTKEDLREIQEANDQLDELDNRITVMAGKLIGAIGFSARAYAHGLGKFPTMYAAVGDLEAQELEDRDRLEIAQRRANERFAAAKRIEEARAALKKYNDHLHDLALRSGTAEQKISILNGRIQEQQRLAEKEVNDPAAYMEHLTKIADLEGEVADARRKQSEERRKAIQAENEALKKQADTVRAVGEAEQRAREAAGALATARGDRSRFSLSELAGMPVIRGAGWGRWFANNTDAMAGQIMQARQVMMLEGRAEQLARFGNLAGSQELYDRADKLRSGLTALRDSDRYPFRAMEHNATEQTKALNELVTAAKRDGIQIIPKNG